MVTSSAVLERWRSPSSSEGDSFAADHRKTSRLAAFRCTVLLFPVFFSVALGLQYLTGAFNAELAGYPDEPAHFVSGLMVRDYIAEGFPASPIHYATEYYRRYPKVAIGHWPPAFYVLQGIWMLAFGATRTSALMLMAVIAAALALLPAYCLCRAYGWRSAVLAGGIVVTAPAVREQTAMIMPEMLVAACGFAAVVYLARYLDSLDWKDSARFGVLASLCILTKGNGWAIALVPPLALLLMRRYALFTHRSFWAGALVIGALCVPWHLLTAEFVRHVWTRHSGELAYWVVNFSGVALSLPALTGTPVFLLCLAGIAVTLRHQSGSPHALYISMLALLLAVVCLHTFVPLDVEKRKLLLAVPALAFFAASACTQFIRRFRVPVLASVAPVLIPACMVLIYHSEVPLRERRGLAHAAELAIALQPTRGSKYLVSGSAEGEGAFIAEVAIRRGTKGDRIVLRGSKSLASSDWNGGGYRPRFSRAGNLKQFLDDQRVSVIVLEGRSHRSRAQHHKLLAQVVQDNPREWVLARSTLHHDPGHAIQVFQRFDISVSDVQDTRSFNQGLLDF